MMFERDFSFFNSPRYETYEPFGFGPRYVRRDDPFWNSQQRRQVPRKQYRKGYGPSYGDCNCGHCNWGEHPKVAPQQERYRDIPINVTTKSGQTEPKISPDPVLKPKINRQKNQEAKQKKPKNSKEIKVTTSGAKEHQLPRKPNNSPPKSTEKLNVGDRLDVGDRSNLTKEEPILVQLSTAEIKHVDFDPFQADEEIEIPPCL